MIRPATRGVSRTAGAAILAVTLAAAASAPRQQPADVPPRSTFRTDANFVRVDVYPIHGNAKPAETQVLDRAGRELKIPVSGGDRQDAAAGQRWRSAELSSPRSAPATTSSPSASPTTACGRKSSQRSR